MACKIFDMVTATEVHALKGTEYLAVQIAEQSAAQTQFFVNDGTYCVGKKFSHVK